MRSANIIINQTHLQHNLQQTKQHTPSAKILAMVKANAYGHDVKLCLPALQNADALGVATFTEGLQLRKLGWQKNIVLIEGVFSEQEWQQAIEHNFSCVIHHQPQLEWAIKHPPKPNSPSQQIWLKYNTGMNRLGFQKADIIDITQKLHQKQFSIILISHFANADLINHPMNQEQGQKFTDLLTQLRHQISPNIQGSLCNSAGILNFPQWHFNWVRPGIMLYGSSPIQHQTANDLNLKPVMTFTANIMAIQNIKKGEQVGYGGRWQVEKDSQLALVSIGYGDGYPRGIDENTYVGIINQQQTYLCPIRGRVAMDMLVIDLTELPDTISQHIQIGTPVILWGDKPHIDDLANHANTISYELMCRLTDRPTKKVILQG